MMLAKPGAASVLAAKALRLLRLLMITGAQAHLESAGTFT